MLLDDLMRALADFFFSLLYRLFAGICLIIDFIKTIFYKLCGIETVTIDGEESDLLSSLMSSENIRRAFLIITIIGVILLVVFTIIAIIRSCYQEKQNWKTVMSKNMQSFIIMILVPFTMMAGILLTNVVMASINRAMQNSLNGSNGCIGGQFLVTIGSDAYKGNLSERGTIEQMFISGEFDYNDLDLVKTYYDINSCNYVIGILGSIVILVMFALSSISFVQRIFDVVLLYLISPVSISTIPLDEGNRFKVWKDMLISKVLSAYGIILTMNLFFLIIPIVYQINFFHNGFQNGLVYILFLIGGSFAVSKGARLISQLTGGSSSGGEMASMIYNVRSAMAFSKAAKAVIGGGTMGLLVGSDYKEMRKKKKSREEAFKASLHSTRNQKAIKEGVKKSKAKQVMGMPLRMATMPMGMLHDLSRGGLIQMGRNFMPRLKNAFTGDTLVNRAEVKKKPKKDDAKKTNDENKQEKEESAKTESERKEGSVKPDGKESSNTESKRGGPEMKKEEEKPNESDT